MKWQSPGLGKSGLCFMFYNILEKEGASIFDTPSGRHCTTQPCGTQDDTHRTTAEAQPRTTSGMRLCTGAIWHAPHVATTPRGEIRGYARLPPPPGWRKCSPPVIVSAAGGDADAAHVGNVERGTLFALRRVECANSGGFLRLG